MDFVGRTEDEDALRAELEAAFASVRSRSALSLESLRITIEGILQGRLGETAADAAEALLLAQDADRATIDSARSASHDWAASYASGVVAEMTGRWQATIQHDLLSGLTIAAAIAGTLDSARATAVAVTETTRAISMGEYVGQAKAIRRGMDAMIPYWMCEPGACPICRPFNNQPPRVWRPKFPFGPGAHPHCRCYLDWRSR